MLAEAALPPETDDACPCNCLRPPRCLPTLLSAQICLNVRNFFIDNFGVEVDEGARVSEPTRVPVEEAQV